MKFIKLLLTETLPNIPALQFKEFDPNQIVRIIANTIVTLAVLCGILYGGWTLAQGFTSQDPREKQQGIVTMIGSLAVGGLIMVILNLILN